MDKYIGKCLDDRYLIQEVVGTGGMAVVYKAMDTQQNRTVAVKILRDECMKNEELVRRFKNESKAISVLDHKNLVKVYDVSVSQNLQYIAMEYIDGITLKDYMKRKKQPLSYKEIMHFIIQTLNALQHAHSKGIVHRDIKPQNIMLLSNGVIKVMDFGIARFSRSENHTMTDKAIGSVHYISPEQAKGDVTDHKADIYSVGVMLYEMLAGRLPFDGDSPVGVAIKQISDVATPLKEINPNVPPALQSITERAMAKEPRERYQTASAMLADLDVFIKNPNATFDYKYVAETSSTKLIDKVVAGTGAKKSSQNTNSTNKGTRKHKTRHFKNKWVWPVLTGGTLAFFLVSVFACYLILQDTVLFVEAPDVDLPNFVGAMRSDVENNSEYSMFTNIVFEEVEDPDNPEGMIISQNPKYPKLIKSTTQITLRVSKGIVQIPVPEVVGAEQSVGIQQLKDSGLSVMIRYVAVENETDPYGFILELTLSDGSPIGPGQLLDSGTVVQAHISSAFRDNMVVVPNLVELVSVEEAQNRLQESRLYVGVLTYEDSLYPVGTIIRQNPAYVENPTPDTDEGMIMQGSLVDLVVSQGHTHAFVDISRINPVGCTTAGLVTYSCSICNEQKQEPVAALGHLWGEWTPLVNPDGGDPIEEMRICKRDPTHTETRTIEESSSTPSSSSSESIDSSSSETTTPPTP